MRRLRISQLVKASGRMTLCATALAVVFPFTFSRAESQAQPPASVLVQSGPAGQGAAPGTPATAVAAGKDDKSEKMLQRLEQLFIWRVSDRLSLTPQQETEFSNEFRKISEERSALSRQLDSILDQIEKEKGNSTKEVKLIADYEGTLKKYNQCQTKEMDVMRHLFDTKKMVEYMLLKRDMSLKIKDVLVQPRSTSKDAPKALLKEPQVIQEK